MCALNVSLTDANTWLRKCFDVFLPKRLLVVACTLTGGALSLRCLARPGPVLGVSTIYLHVALALI
jgi:hypothetical protein